MPLTTAKKPTTKRRPAPLNPSRLHRELTQLRARVDGLEDLRELNDAISRNGTQPGIPWHQAKAKLGL
jgi:hypothetical protein